MGRISTGINGLDEHLDGGYPDGTVILLSGGPGAGKTLYGLSYLVDGASKKEKGCYVSFSEDEDGLKRACQGIKSLEKVDKLKKNLILNSIDLSKDTNVEGFIETVERYPNFDRLVIDNVNKLLMFSDDGEYRLQLTSLVNYLRKKVGCTILVCETNNGIDTGNGESFECDGVISISFEELEEVPKRGLSIEKMRYTSIESKVRRELVIDNDGLKIGESELI